MVLIDVPDIPLLEALLARGQSLLVVVSSPVMLDRLVDHFEETRPAGLGLCSQLLGADGEEVCWYRYNDSRQDGRLPPQQLQPLFPNLRLEGLEARSLGRLDDLVEGWSERLGTHQGTGALIVRAGGLLPVLRGSTVLLQDLGLVVWWPGEAGESESELAAIDGLLAPYALAGQDGTGAQIRTWKRDEQLHLQNALLAARVRAEALQAANVALEQEQANLQARLEQLDPLPAQLQQLEADYRELLQRHQLSTDALQRLEKERLESTGLLDHWRGEWDQALAEGARLRNQEVQLHAAIHAVQAEAEQWRIKFESKQTDLRGLEEQFNDLRQMLNDGNREGELMNPLKQQLLLRLEAARFDADRVAAERDRAAAERDQLAAERDRLAAERAAGLEQREALQLEKQALEEQMLQLAQKVSRSESQLETLKIMLLGYASPAATETEA